LASLRPILVQANEGTELYHMLKDVVRIIPPGDVAALEEGVTKAQTTNPDVSRYGEIAALFGRDAALATLLDVLVGGEPEPAHASLGHDAPQAALTPSVSGAAAR
jgi:hypothetical protein